MFLLTLSSIPLIFLSIPCSARIETAVIVPHGDFAYDPTLLPIGSQSRKVARKVAVASRQAAMSLLTNHNNLDVVMLSTPHGMALTHDFALFMGKTASGTAVIGKDLDINTTVPSYTVSLPTIGLCPEMAAEMIQHLKHQQHSCNTTGIMVPDDSIDMPLYWGEVIPLILMNIRNTTNNNTNTNQASPRTPHFLILSHPRRRLKEAPSMVTELLRLGQDLRSIFETQFLDIRVGVLISGDLSHTHLPEGPYGYSNASSAFDAAVGAWANGTVCKNGEFLLQTAKSLQTEAKACAFTGLVLLHGLLCSDRAQQQQQDEWRGFVLANHNATYYGMMAATFQRVPPEQPASIQ